MLLKPELLVAVRGLITQARERAVRAVDTERVLLYWHIGRVILEEEQRGADRATYGSNLSLAVGFRDGNWNATGSSIVRSRLRPPCGRN
jgi:hypothetical protein